MRISPKCPYVNLAYFRRDDATPLNEEIHKYVSFPFSTLCKYKKFRCEFPQLNTTESVHPLDQVKSGDADIADQPMLISPYFIHGVELSPINTFSPLHFVIKNTYLEFSWKPIISPFTYWVWLVIFFSTLVAGVLMFTIITYEKSTEDNNRGWSKNRFVWFLLGSFLNQGANLNVRCSSSRVALAFWILPVLIIGWGYSGTLTSFMLTNKKQSLPKTFEELASAVQKGKFTCTAPDNPKVMRFFENSKQTYLKILYNEILSNDIMDTYDLIMNGDDESFDYSRVAYIYNMGSMKISDFEMTLDVTVSDDVLLSMPAAFVMRKGFSHKEYFNKILYNIFESGVQEHDREVDMMKNPVFRNVNERAQMSKAIKSDVDPLVLSNFYGAFATLVIGYFLSFACFLVELISGKMIR
ncbi:glutamate receptor 3-like [Centruroides vittatus]|uniref:glutamate receptor 3-like n=1 Tax=Centruroides vittatus TaxID=120091 RepID=UPI00350EA9FE